MVHSALCCGGDCPSDRPARPCLSQGRRAEEEGVSGRTCGACPRQVARSAARGLGLESPTMLCPGPERASQNGKPAFVPRQRQYRSTRPLTRDQNGHAGFLIHTAYGRRRPGRYHTILPGETTPPNPQAVATTRVAE